MTVDSVVLVHQRCTGLAGVGALAAVGVFVEIPLISNYGFGSKSQLSSHWPGRAVVSRFMSLSHQ